MRVGCFFRGRPWLTLTTFGRSLTERNPFSASRANPPQTHSPKMDTEVQERLKKLGATARIGTIYAPLPPQLPVALLSC